MSASRTTKTIGPPRGWIGFELQELWRYRELLFFLTWRDVKIRYKQTVLGVLWAFIQPFMKMVVFSVIFGRWGQMDSEGHAYPVFLYAGLLPWQFFQDSLTRSSQSIAGSGNLIQKIYFPRLIIPIASTGACLVDFCVSFVILAGLMIYYGISATPALLMIMPLVLLTVMTALGTGILLSALNAAYRDFRYVVGFVLNMWMFLTPVIYPVRFVPERWQWLLKLNPMTGIVDAYRAAIFGRQIQWDSLTISAVVTIAVLVFGGYYFRKTEVRFADIV